jgi:hypothetical protein
VAPRFPQLQGEYRKQETCCPNGTLAAMERMENPLRRKPGKNVVSLCGDKSVEKAYSFFYVFLNAIVI